MWRQRYKDHGMWTNTNILKSVCEKRACGQRLVDKDMRTKRAMRAMTRRNTSIKRTKIMWTRKCGQRCMRTCANVSAKRNVHKHMWTKNDL